MRFLGIVICLIKGHDYRKIVVRNYNDLTTCRRCGKVVIAFCAKAEKNQTHVSDAGLTTMNAQQGNYVDI